MSEGAAPLGWDQAQTFAGWFRALADGRRVQILNLLAAERAPLSVKEIVERVEIGQSTVSHHLRILAQARFLSCEQRGTASLYRINEACLTCFPTAADVVMGRSPAALDRVSCEPGERGARAPSRRDSPERGARAPSRRDSPERGARAPSRRDQDDATLAALRDRYAAVARGAAAGEGGSCLPTGVGEDAYADVDLAAAPATAVRASLGCGNPVAAARLREGETVLDLGSGGGLDVIIAARRVGAAGRAIGLDMTPEMLALARASAEEAGVANTEFLLGRIEDIPLPDASVDAVVSNCVLTLSLDKAAAFSEIARVLRPGGRLDVSDLIADPAVPEHLRAVCPEADGAASLTAAQYRELLAAAGLTGVDVRVTGRVGEGLHAAIVRARRPGVRIAPMTAAHADRVLAIYQQGIDGGQATLETAAPPWETWDAAHLDAHRFVASDLEHGAVVGWAALSPVSERCVYGGVAESSVYVHPDAGGLGVGRTLMDAVVASSEAAGIWTLQAGILPENAASLALHHAVGFRTVGVRERIGRHRGRWRDVVLLERRSTIAGAD